MARCKYPMLSEHIDEHRNFVYRMRQTIASFDENPTLEAVDTRDALVTYLENWWHHHILVEDRKYKRFAEKNLRQSSQAVREVRGYEIWWG